MSVEVTYTPDQGKNSNCESRSLCHCQEDGLLCRGGLIRKLYCLFGPKAHVGGSQDRTRLVLPRQLLAWHYFTHWLLGSGHRACAWKEEPSSLSKGGEGLHLALFSEEATISQAACTVKKRCSREEGIGLDNPWVMDAAARLPDAWEKGVHLCCSSS